MSDGSVNLLIAVIAALSTAWAVYLTYKGNEKIWKLEAAVTGLEAQIKTLEAVAGHQKESAQKSDEVHAAELKAVNIILEAERELRRKSDTANEAVIAGLRKEITSLTEQLAKAEERLAKADARNEELASELKDMKRQFNDLLQVKTQTPALAPATEAKET